MVLNSFGIFQEIFKKNAAVCSSDKVPTENFALLNLWTEFFIPSNYLIFLSVDRWQRNYLDQPASPNTYLRTLLWNEKTRSTSLCRRDVNGNFNA